ncbi:lipoyl synthase [Lachnospiraceae bacterium ZAX-1]
MNPIKREAYTPKPAWLRIKYVPNAKIEATEGLLAELGLNTVCAEANCPNYLECFSRKVATFMILGIHCTRNCKFCNVAHNEPQAVDDNEAEKVAKAIQTLGLKYAVITSVTRDDLEDGGANHFAKVVRKSKELSQATAIETLIPDLKGDINSLKLVVDSNPEVISHNIETVPRLYDTVRPEAIYQRSLEVLSHIKDLNNNIYSKTGLILGLGETKEEVIEVFNDLLAHKCDFLTIGQYLAPSKLHHPVIAFITPEQFDEYRTIAKAMGFKHVASAPLVRSSYHANEAIGL